MSTLSKADVAAHDAASYVRRPQRVLARVPAGNPRGSLAAKERASELGADFEMDLATDDFLIVARAVGVSR